MYSELVVELVEWGKVHSIQPIDSNVLSRQQSTHYIQQVALAPKIHRNVSERLQLLVVRNYFPHSRMAWHQAISFSIVMKRFNVVPTKLRSKIKR